MSWTFTRYLSWRFLQAIGIVFFMIAGMIYVVDFVEMLRRAGEVPGITTGRIAYFSFLRAPSVSEQIMPFCILFGTMAAYINLTRTSELLVARAIGLSAWGFLLPPLVIAFSLGAGSVILFDPIAAEMKHRSEAIEAQLFGRNGRQSDDTSIWIRQKNVDGEAFINAEAVSVDGIRLAAPIAYIFDKNGIFEERIHGRIARLWPGVWQFNNAQIAAPGEETFATGTFLLAASTSPEEVLRGVVAPDSVPLWDLPALRRAAEQAGLDGTAYQLQLHALLARPLLFIAMVLVAAAFSLRSFRFGGVGKMVVGGVSAGFVLFAATKFIGDLGGSGLLNPVIAGWSPAVVASLLGALALLNQEDG